MLAAFVAACGTGPETDPRVLAAQVVVNPPAVERSPEHPPTAPFAEVAAPIVANADAAPGAERSSRSDRPTVRPTAVVLGHYASTNIDAAVQHAFAAAEPTIPLRYVPADDREAVELVLVGRAELCLIGGALSARETQAGLRQVCLGVELFGVAVPSQSPLRSITRRQLRQVFTGELTDWGQVGGRAEPIVLVVPKDDALAARAARCLIPGDPFAANAVRVEDDDASAAQLREHAGAIAVVRIGDERRPDGQKLLQIDWAPPTVEAFAYGTYPFGIPLQLVTSGAPRGVAARFVEFARSPDGQALLRRRLVAVP